MASKTFTPAYRHTFQKGLLWEKIHKAENLLEACSVCPRNCGVDRTKNEKGFCGAGDFPEVSSYSPHFGEERPLVGRHGSGTIFLTRCNLGCRYCQNYSISHRGDGEAVTNARLAQMMLELQRLGCHNINFVSPTHFVPQILRALSEAIPNGLSVPLVYNTGGYDSVETLQLMEGLFDIYMPDFKYSRSAPAQTYSQAPDYPQVAKAALKEMHRQVGDLQINDNNIAKRGLLVRHLVLPEDLAGTREIVHFLAHHISKDTYVNIMDQYYPCGDIPRNSPLGRRITSSEFENALEAAHQEGITRLDKRERLRLVWF